MWKWKANPAKARRFTLRFRRRDLEYDAGIAEVDLIARSQLQTCTGSTRDIEAAFRDAEGRSLLSRTAVSQVTERLWQEYEGFATRDLSEFAVAYLFVDGVAERLHAGMPREAVLCAWGITEEGRKVLLHLAPPLQPRRQGPAEHRPRCADALEHRIAFSVVAWGIVTARWIWPELRLRSRAEALRPLLEQTQEHVRDLQTVLDI